MNNVRNYAGWLNWKTGLGLFVALIGVNTFQILGPTQIGVYKFLGKVQKGSMAQSGLNFKCPLLCGIDVYEANIQEEQFPAAAATKDLQDLTAELTVFYTVDPGPLTTTRTRIGTMPQVKAKVRSLTQEAFKASSAQYTAEEAITKREQLRKAFDEGMSKRLSKFGINFEGSAIENLSFSPKFNEAVEAKQIAEQQAKQAIFEAKKAEAQAQAEINRAKGKAEAQRLLAETLKSQGGKLVLQKEAIAAWREGGAQMPKVLVMDGKGNNSVPFLFNLGNVDAQQQ
ncbi:prohibitin family protein [Acaryochloris sp. IP29b_bin.137]|uniref:prohibitin family protein n=1 Tax=Acaryochloris sp. IP29b_bin.137 TaxID=2969217 RepID=UPI0026114231|nr:prohibitin family protein [Acaryochloris sp. IP29b_bin.137]